MNLETAMTLCSQRGASTHTGLPSLPPELIIPCTS